MAPPASSSRSTPSRSGSARRSPGDGRPHRPARRPRRSGRPLPCHGRRHRRSPSSTPGLVPSRLAATSAGIVDAAALVDRPNRLAAARPSQLRSTAYALEATLQELFFLCGRCSPPPRRGPARRRASREPVWRASSGAAAPALSRRCARRLHRATVGRRAPRGAGRPGVRTVVPTRPRRRGLRRCRQSSRCPRSPRRTAPGELGGLALGCFSAGSLSEVFAGGAAGGDDSRRFVVGSIGPRQPHARLLARRLDPEPLRARFLAGLADRTDDRRALHADRPRPRRRAPWRRRSRGSARPSPSASPPEPSAEASSSTSEASAGRSASAARSRSSARWRLSRAGARSA